MYKKLIQIAEQSRDHLDEDAIETIVQFIEDKQSVDGGFKGRNIFGSDLYYSMFATLAYLSLTNKIPKGIQKYITEVGNPEDFDLIHLCALSRLYQCTKIPLSGPQKARFATELETYRTQDGGYSHIAQYAEKSTPYGIFLAVSAYHELEIDITDDEKLIDALLTCSTKDSGFSNTPETGIGTTNATAAALTAITMLQQKSKGRKMIKGGIKFLLSMRFPWGGFKAMKDAPLPDILSTATTLFALNQLQYSIPKEFKQKTLIMIENHWAESGGFFGNQGETLPDCEYTFYALLAMGAVKKNC